MLHTRTMSGLAVLGLFSLLLPAQQTKKPKDQGEYDIYNQVLKDSADPAKQLADLDRWAQQYPQTDFSFERQFFYVSAYNGVRQSAKVLSAAAAIMDKDFPDPKQKLTVLYLAAINIQGAANPSDEQLAIAKTAAQQLLAFTPTFFTADKKPAGATDADWTKARTDLERAADDSLDFVATAPGTRALAGNANDPANCAAAEVALKKGLEQRPASARVALALASALRCQQATDATKVKFALYYYARAAALEPGQGGFTDAKQRQTVDTYLGKAYEKFHGSADGLDRLKQTALASPVPATTFELKSSAELSAEKDAEFQRTNPQLALWLGIKKELTDTGGAEFFETKLKGAGVPKLKGTLIEAKPVCHPRDLTVAISDPKQAEVTLHLAAPLAGRAELGGEIQWEGIPSAFTGTPFLLTMTTEAASIENLKVSPCAAARPKK